MGPILSKPVTTKVLERKSTKLFHIGVGFMNGYREKMEDAHTVMPNDDEGWGFFGVFDGHCGPLCSKYVADRFPQLISDNIIPITDDKLRDLSLQIDDEFLQGGKEGGSTGTFLFAIKQGDGYHLQVGNVGDSRVVLGRKKDQSEYSLTEDHKPCLEGEKKRIEAAGGHVHNNRVDGALAVSRAFGDGTYKGRGQPFASKVIAVPEFTHFDAEAGDIVLLACDGVFESDVFSNASVIEFIYEKLETTKDLAAVAAAVCDEAMHRGSKDNISAMIVQLGGESPFEGLPEHAIEAGRLSIPGNKKFYMAYEGMCEQANLTVESCVELRFDQITSERKRIIKEVNATKNGCDLNLLSNEDLHHMVHRLVSQEPISRSREDCIEILRELENENVDLRPISLFNIEEELQEWSVPSNIAEMEPGSEARIQWFREWIEVQRATCLPSQDPMEMIQRELSRLKSTSS